MNRNDYQLIIALFFISLISLFVFNMQSKHGKNAKVYYEDKVILNIDLSIDKEYEVTGYNGNMKIEVKDGKIRVVEENSLYHICSKQGYISTSIETIICLPNKIVIKIEDNDNLDGVMR